MLVTEDYTVCFLRLRGTDQALARSPDVKAFNLVFSAAFKFIGDAAIHLSFSYISMLNLVCSERFLFVELPVLGCPDMREQCKWCPEKGRICQKVIIRILFWSQVLENVESTETHL